MEKDTENAHTSSQDNNKQANKVARKMDQYTQQKWTVAIVRRPKRKLLHKSVQQRYRMQSI